VLIDRGRAYTQSAAVLGIARRLRWPWPLFWALVIVPRCVRDFVYRGLADHRHRWCGRSETGPDIKKTSFS
jgi:predicted DCC family thiol-disulfide oxidoreductase YuxK